MTTREKFGSFVAAIRCPNKECHDKGFTMYPEDMEDNILPCLCHGCGKMFYVEIDQEESLEELEKDKIEKLSEESDDILDREERPVRRRRISEEKPETKRPERRKPERKERQEEDKSSQKHRSFLMNFEDDDDEVYDEEDDFDFDQYQKRLQKRQNKKKQEKPEMVRRRRERLEDPEELFGESEDDIRDIQNQPDLKSADLQAKNDEDDWEEFSFIKKQKKYMSPERKSEQRSLKQEEEETKDDLLDEDLSFEADFFKHAEDRRPEKAEKKAPKKKAGKNTVFDEDSELNREFEAMLDDDSDEWFFGDEKKSDFGKFRNIFQRKGHK